MARERRPLRLRDVAIPQVCSALATALALVCVQEVPLVVAVIIFTPALLAGVGVAAWGGGSADAVDLCCWRCAHRAGDPDRCQPRWHPPFPARVAGSVGAVPSSMIGVAVFSVNGEIGPVAMLIVALLMMAAQRIWLYPACHGARDPRIPLGLVPSDGHELICRAGQLSIQKRVNCGMDKDLHLSVTLLSVGSSALPARLSVRTCSCVKRAPGRSFVLPWVSVPTSSIQR